MERAVALTKLRTLLGKTMGYRIDTKAPTPEERAAAKDVMPAAIAQREAAQEAREARAKFLLDNDAEYQSCCAVAKSAWDYVDKLFSITYRHKFTVGKMSSLFFHVIAEGDTWEEVIEKVQAWRKEHRLIH